MVEVIESIKVIESIDKHDFEQKVNNFLVVHYKIISTNCGIIESSLTGAQVTLYQAILQAPKFLKGVL